MPPATSARLQGYGYVYLTHSGNIHTENALKSKYNGGTPTFGYVIDKDMQYQIDPRTAPAVLEMFTMYDKGATMKEIVCYILRFNGVHQRCKNSILTRILERFQPLFFLLCKLLFLSQIFSKEYLAAVCLECRSCRKHAKTTLFSIFWTVK